MATEPLSRQRILEAAFGLADEQGLDGVTMRSVAASLGVEAMSLYHHVPNKKAIMDGLVDLLVQVAELPSGDLTAEAWIRGTGRGLRSLAQQHPRLVPLFETRSVPLDDPLAALPFESGLAAFCREGRSLAQGFAAVQTVAVALLALAQLEATTVLTGAVESADDGSSFTGLPLEDFPLLHQVPAAGVGIEDFWSTLVEALVRGLDSHTM